MKYHFIYKTTNVVTGKFYIGMHSTNKMDDGYLGSGIHLRRSLRKYGRENHTLEILESCPDRDALRIREISIIDDEMLANPLCMNMKLGGTGGFDDKMRNASHAARKSKKERDPDYKERMRVLAVEAAKKVTPEGRRACSEALKARYADPEFKERQRQIALKANKASHESRRRKKLLLESGKDKVDT